MNERARIKANMGKNKMRWRICGGGEQQQQQKFSLSLFDFATNFYYGTFGWLFFHFKVQSMWSIEAASLSDSFTHSPFLLRSFSRSFINDEKKIVQKKYKIIW